MRVILNMNCRYGGIGQVVDIPQDVLKKYPQDTYEVIKEKKEVKDTENKAILEPKKTKGVFSKKK